MTFTTDNCKTNPEPTVSDTVEAMLSIAYQNMLNLGLDPVDACRELVKAGVALLPETECGVCLIREAMDELEGPDEGEAMH